MPDMREGGLGTAACYLTVERLALQAGVESPFWDGASLLMGGCEEPTRKGGSTAIQVPNDMYQIAVSNRRKSGFSLEAKTRNGGGTVSVLYSLKGGC